MNRQFYEFWGQVFLDAARSQASVDTVVAWMKQGFSGIGQLAELFQRCYGLQPSAVDPEQPSLAWQQAVDEFQQAFTRFAGQWGWVSQNDHQKLVDKCNALEKKVAEQQATITQLRGLLTQKGMGYAELFEHFNKALNDQGKQFHALLESVRGPVDKSS